MVEVEERPGYLFIVESGRITGMTDVRRYQSEVDRIVRSSGLRRALIDARGEVGEPAPEVRQAMWDWLLDAERSFDVVAFVLPEGMVTARVNMTALSRGANLRAFETMSAAQRWLARGGRTTVADMRPPSSQPPSTEEGVSGTAKTVPPARGLAYRPTEAAIPAASGQYSRAGGEGGEGGAGGADEQDDSSSVA